MKNRLFRKISLVLVATSILVLSLMMTTSAHAIPPVSYTVGNGSVENPYHIETCQQLVYMSANLEASYKLMNDIDCRVHSFEPSSITPASTFSDEFPIGNADTPFLGNFDGQNHTIDHVEFTIEDTTHSGLFGMIGEDATVKDLNITGIDISNTALFFSGGLAGANLGTITNVTAAGQISAGNVSGGLVGNNLGTITNSSSSVSILIGQNSNGGFVGQNQGTISKSYATGDVAGGEFTGGFAGSNYDTIDQSYSTGNVIGSFTRVGGFVGSFESGTITNSYSRGDVHGVEQLGGFVGGSQDGASITNSYSTGNVTTTLGELPQASVDNFVGVQSGSVSHSFFDATLAGSSDTTSDGIGKSTAAMKTRSTFTDAEWNFDSIWGMNASFNGGYPALQYSIAADADGDGVSNAIENAAPNSGDGNGDGLVDGGQANVTSLVDMNGKYVTIVSPAGTTIIGANNALESSQSAQDRNHEYPFGLTNFTVTGITPGATIEMKLYFQSTDDAHLFDARKLAGTSYSTLVGSSILNVIVGTSTPAVKLTYGITDNGSLDTNSAPGVITDPVGIATGTLPATGNNSGKLLWFAFALIVAGATLLRVSMRGRKMTFSFATR